MNLTADHRLVLKHYFDKARDRVLTVFKRHRWKSLVQVTPGVALDLTILESERETEDDEEMAITKKDLITLANAIVSSQYDGNPSDLRSFIDKLNQLKDVTDDQEATAVNFVKGRLTGNARDCIADTDNTIDLIILKLKNSIKLPSTSELKAELKAKAKLEF